MSGSIKRILLFLYPFVMGAAPCMAQDHEWTVVTLTRAGSWGVASNNVQPQAIADAIRRCRAVAGPASDCGAQIMAAKGGWIVANLCGDHKIIATGSSLLDAEQEALNREISLQLFYVPDLATCRRVVTVDPSGTIIPSHQQYSTAREAGR
jgi:hypothetical protein